VRRYFDFERHGTTYGRRHWRDHDLHDDGYIIIVNPRSSKRPACEGAFHGGHNPLSRVRTVVMGLYARRPFAIAPYMGRTRSLPSPW